MSGTFDGPIPGCELDTNDELFKVLHDPNANPVCKRAARARQLAIANGVMIITPDGRIVPSPFPRPGESAAEHQVTLAWTHLMRTLGYEVPRLLRRATYYRARLDDAVRYTPKTR